MKRKRLARALAFSAALAFLAILAAGCRPAPAGERAGGAAGDLRGEGLVVLCYHRVLPPAFLRLGRFLWPSEAEFSRFAVDSREFAAQIDHLRRHGVRFVTPEEAERYLKGEERLPGKLVLITFDDGDLSVYREAFPVLRERRIPFLLFLITGQAGKRWQGFAMCSWEQVREMAESGLCTVGLHTHDMHYLDRGTGQPVFLLPGREPLFASDVAAGKSVLRRELGAEARHFAYPYGFGNAATDRILASAGIPNVYTLRPKVNRPGDPRSSIGRILVTPESWPQVAAWAEEEP